MTVPLSAESPRRLAARRYGVLLRRTMERKGIGTKRLAPAAGVATSAIACWRAGDNLPTLRVALRVAEALDEPRLATIVRDARRGACAYCARPFLNEGGKPRIYCGPDCRDAAARDRNPIAATAARERGVGILRAELLRVGAVRKQQIGKALTLLTDEEERSPGLVARRRLPVFEAAIDAMCGGCEPLGYCRDESCPLRAVSPLPLLEESREAAPATKAPGLHSPEHEGAWLAAVRAGNARRWSREGEREKASQMQRARHASQTREERAAWIDSIRATKQKRRQGPRRDPVPAEQTA